MQLESEQTAPAILDWFVRGAVGQQQKIRQDFPGERLINPRVFRQALTRRLQRDGSGPPPLALFPGQTKSELGPDGQRMRGQFDIRRMVWQTCLNRRTQLVFDAFNHESFRRNPLQGLGDDMCR